MPTPIALRSLLFKIQIIKQLKYVTVCYSNERTTEFTTLRAWACVQRRCYNFIWRPRDAVAPNLSFQHYNTLQVASTSKNTSMQNDSKKEFDEQNKTETPISIAQLCKLHRDKTNRSRHCVPDRADTNSFIFHHCDPNL